MKRTPRFRWLATPLLLAAVLLAFGLLEPGFLSAPTLRNILVQSSSVAIVAVGMTFVLITGGIDLSVGAIMFLTAAVAGRLVAGGSGWATPAALALIPALGLAFGAVNAGLVASVRLVPFVATLATLFVGRGLALTITQTRPLDLPPGLLAVGRASPLGVPLPVVLMIGAAVLGQWTLSATPFGRHLHAVGDNPEGARKAGLRVGRLIAAAYLISGLCAALGGLVALAQLGVVSPTFGYQREFGAIAAAVLGGTSLTGGRGSVLPGALLGAILIQSVEAGLNAVNADPYCYPVVIGAIVFLAALIDRARLE